jgi:hypothetical protein
MLRSLDGIGIVGLLVDTRRQSSHERRQWHRQSIRQLRRANGRRDARASGERCIIFNWDRPLTKDLALRLRSASCESRERPGWMISTEISRTVVPISESNLKDEQDEARR